jgi:hypothetical protein
VTSIALTAEGKAVTETPRMTARSVFSVGSGISRSATKKIQGYVFVFLV